MHWLHQLWFGYGYSSIKANGATLLILSPLAPPIRRWFFARAVPWLATKLPRLRITVKPASSAPAPPTSKVPPS